IANELGRATSRRSGLMAALRAAFGRATLDGAAGAKGRGKDAGGSAVTSRRPKPEGPCGDGTKADNVCTKDKQCCTGYCRKGMKNKDGKGRCRCIRRGKPCKPSQTCCGGVSCTEGICKRPAPSRPTVPTGKACVAASDTCAESTAACVEYELGTPAGTYCLLPNSSACSGDPVCESNKCASGACATSCTVCASGCPNTTVIDAFNAALPSDVISIAPGTWVEPELYINGANKDNLTFRRCGSTGVTSLTNTTATQFDAIIRLAGAYTLTLENLDFFTTSALNPYYSLILAEGVSVPYATCTLNASGCTFRDVTDTGDSYGAVALRDGTVATFTNCLFKGNYGADDGGAIRSTGDNDPVAGRNQLTIDGCVFEGNQAGNTVGDPGYNGGAIWMTKTNATVSGCTFSNNGAKGGGAICLADSTDVTVTESTFTGNRATDDYSGGAILLDSGGRGAANKAVNLTITGGATFTGNTTDIGGAAIAAWARNNTSVWSVTGATGTATGNTGGIGDCASSGDYGVTWTLAPNCAFP
ncbi:MAG: right-handed parallel beta-helix repeat-containing protein, partial [Thermomicrobiales bacterium]